MITRKKSDFESPWLFLRNFTVLLVPCKLTFSGFVIHFYNKGDRFLEEIVEFLNVCYEKIR